MKSTKGYFITGTDTGVGKTGFSCQLIKKLRGEGHRVHAMKPVASGAVATKDGLRNQDALDLIEACGEPLAYELVNPYVFAAPIAPHIAAMEAGITISLSEIQGQYRQLANDADRMIVEGVGGLLVPLNEEQTLADLARVLRLPLILVVGMRLGCLNHALLSMEPIERLGLPFAGWVANFIDPDFSHPEQNLHSLQKRIPAPLLASIAHGKMDEVFLELTCNKF